MDLNITPEKEQKPARASLFSRAPKPSQPSPEPDEKPKKKRPRRAGIAQLSAVFSLILVGAFVCLAAFVAVLRAERRDGPLTEEKTVVLTREDDDGPIADQLEKAGVIESSMMFSIMAMLDGQRGALKRGEYKFDAGVSMREVEEMLARHKVVKHKIPVPEGLTSEQIVGRLTDSDLLTGEVKETPREGSLYPDTYVFERGDSRNALIAHMTAEQTKMVAQIWAKRAPDLPIKSPGELVTLASIVEKETGKAEERPRVAAVFVNRLRKHMKLQSDPTIVYGLVFGKGTLGHSITKSELQEATPYNTYFIDGLPPGPICNPGRAAMEAVANPAHTSDLFFVADGTGGHAFADSLDQHQKNVAHWRQIEKDAKDAKDHLSPDVPAPSNIRGEAPGMDASRYGALSLPEGAADVSLVDAAIAPAAPQPRASAGDGYPDLPVPDAAMRAAAAAAAAAPPPALPPPAPVAPAPRAIAGDGYPNLPIPDAATRAAALAAPPPPAPEPTPIVAVAKLAPAPAARPAGAFGALAFATSSDPAPATTALSDKLAKVANSRRMMSQLTGAGGSLSAAKLGGGIDSLVVTGVNDPSPGSEDDGPEPVAGGPVGSAPLSPAALADLRARAARYGDGGIVKTDVAVAAASAPAVVTAANGHLHGFDASEGTRLDPLRNQSYDLNSMKTIPSDFK